MQIRKQILGVIIGIFITISFITPAYSYIGLSKKVCEMKAHHLIQILHKVKKGEYYENQGYYQLKQ